MNSAEDLQAEIRGYAEAEESLQKEIKRLDAENKKMRDAKEYWVKLRDDLQAELVRVENERNYERERRLACEEDHERLIAENVRLLEALARTRNGCACRFDEDGETQTEWCSVHARLRDALLWYASELEDDNVGLYVVTRSIAEDGGRRARYVLGEMIGEVRQENKQLDAENKRMREALKWYGIVAGEMGRGVLDHVSANEAMLDMQYDAGRRAREALVGKK